MPTLDQIPQENWHLHLCSNLRVCRLYGAPEDYMNALVGLNGQHSPMFQG